MRFCSRCGAELPEGSQFCPKCGVPAGVARTPKRAYWIWVPIALIALGLLAWAILSGLPFNREPQTPAPREMEVVEEGRPPVEEPAPRARTTEVRKPTTTTTAAKVTNAKAGEISEGEATRALQNFLTSRDLSERCTAVKLIEYKNRGYTFTVHDRCRDQSLGRWRVDSEDASGIFRRHADGRYLRP